MVHQGSIVTAGHQKGDIMGGFATRRAWASRATPFLVLSTLALAGWAAASGSPAYAGPGIDQFEMKDLDSGPGEFQFQSQNAISAGQPQRRVIELAPGKFAYDDNSIAQARYALEMQMGITSWFRTRLGIEYEKQRVDDPSSPARANAFDDLQLSSVALEGVLVFVPVKKDAIGLGLLTEFDTSLKAGGKQLYAGPIVQAVSGPWSGIANLLLVQHFGAPDRLHLLPSDRSVDFAYALQVQYELSPTWAVALEGYGTFDRIMADGNQAQTLAQFGRFDQHRAGPVIYYRFNPDPKQGGKPGSVGIKGVGGDDDDAPGKGSKLGADKAKDKDTSVSLGVGLLFGLNANTPSQTLKLSLEYNF